MLVHGPTGAVIVETSAVRRPRPLRNETAEQSFMLFHAGCFRRLEHLPSHVISSAFNFVQCPCSRSDIMPP